MPQKKPPPSRPPNASQVEEYQEERIPFDQVMRKLASTKPPHKAPKQATVTKPKKISKSG
jgi:hypothetical protein